LRTRFHGSASRPEHDYTWWFYSLGTYREILAMLGFRIERITEHAYLNRFENRRQSRPTIVAKRVP
jgi:hypothetical protein